MCETNLLEIASERDLVKRENNAQKQPYANKILYIQAEKE